MEHLGNGISANEVVAARARDDELQNKEFDTSNCSNPYGGANDGELVIKDNNEGMNEEEEEEEEEEKGDLNHITQLGRGSRSGILPRESIFRNESGVRFNSWEEKEKKLDLLERKGKGIDQVAAGVERGGCRKPISSYRESLGDNRLKVLSSSSFGNFFSKNYLQGKGVESKGLETQVKFRHGTTKPIKTQKPFNALETPKPAEDQPSSWDTYKGDGPISSSHSKINLREWLHSGASGIKKVERLQLFSQIVQLVDIAHSEGIALLDLRLSNFVFEFPNGVKYAGSFSGPSELVGLLNKVETKKRPLEQDMQSQDVSGVKQQNLGKDVTTVTNKDKHFSAFGIIRADTSNVNTEDYDYSKSILASSCLDPDIVQLEKKWYACPTELIDKDLISSNIYSLGVLLFELLYCFESSDKHSAAMWDLSNRILPANFLAENPKEAGFCFWLLHPEPSCRPKTREILQSATIYSSGEGHSDKAIPSCFKKDEDAAVPSCFKKEEDTESELLLHFLVSMEEQKRNQVSTLLGGIECLDADIKEVVRKHIPEGPEILPKQYANLKVLQRTFSITDMLEENLVKNITQLEKAYFSLRSELKLKEIPSLERSDKDILSHRDRVFVASDDPKIEGKPVDRVGDFFEGVCRFARHRKFEVCGGLKNGGLVNSSNVLCSLSFDRDEEYIAAAGVSRKIKIFEFSSLLNDSVDIQYSMVEMSNKSKLSCVCWNHYIKNYLASTDYDGAVQIWDASTSQAFAYYDEHQKRAWSVDFSRVDPAQFASGSDDCSVKLWSIAEKNSTRTIRNPANVCCVQFSAYSSHLLAFGSADYKIYCYDLRHTRIPWCTLASHGKTVSYVKFLDSETLISASTDNTLKLWDLKKTSLEGLSLDACSVTFTGHTNEKNFVGLSVSDGYIACGSETNEVYMYYKSLPMPITSHKFGYVDPISGHEIDDSNGQFVSSVCWRTKSNIVVSANSSGSIKLLRMV